jgi:ABC-type uncharacterized transport system permease subunit
MLGQIFTFDFLVSLLSSTVRLATPILVPALGQIFTQLSGVLNLGVEGTMLMGAVTAFIVASSTHSLWLGLIAGMVAGLIWSLLMAVLSVSVKTNQVIAGIGLNILAAGVAAYVYRLVFGVRQLPPKVEPFQSLNIPLLSDIPVIGPIFFRHNILVYIGYLLVILAWFVLDKTQYGLKVKAVGEHPRAADSKGINVTHIRYSATLIGGVCAGYAGAFMSIAYLNTFTDALIGGRGFIAVAVVIFSSFKPVRAMWGALLFGFASALQMRLQALGIDVANQLMLMLPYVLTIVALVFASKKAAMPSAYAQPYSRMKR